MWLLVCSGSMSRFPDLFEILICSLVRQPQFVNAFLRDLDFKDAKAVRLLNHDMNDIVDFFNCIAYSPDKLYLRFFDDAEEVGSFQYWQVRICQCICITTNH